MSSKISPLTFVRDYIDTLYDHRDGKASLVDYLVFFGLPAILGDVAFVHRLQFPAVESFVVVASLLTVVTFVGVLQTVSIKLQSRLHDAFTPNDDTLVREFSVNAAYTSFVGLTAVFVALLHLTVEVPGLDVERFTGAVLFFLSVHLFLNFMMCLKRVHMLSRRLG